MDQIFMTYRYYWWRIS